jgi:hypothetical protein
MKSIKTNPNSAKGPDKGKIVNKLYCILLTKKKLLYSKLKTDIKLEDYLKLTKKLTIDNF